MVFAMLFDVDGTLHPGNLTFSIPPFLESKGLLSREASGALLKLKSDYEERKVSQDETVLLATTLFSEGVKGETCDEVKAACTSFVEKQPFYDNVEGCFERARKRGIDCFLVSGAPDLLVEPVAAVLGGVEFAATPIPSNSVFTGQPPPAFYTSGKKGEFYDSIKKGYEAVCGFGDSNGDLGLFQDRAVLVNARDGVEVGHERVRRVEGEDFLPAFRAGLELLGLGEEI